MIGLEIETRQRSQVKSCARKDARPTTIGLTSGGFPPSPQTLFNLGGLAISSASVGAMDIAANRNATCQHAACQSSRKLPSSRASRASRAAGNKSSLYDGKPDVTSRITPQPPDGFPAFLNTAKFRSRCLLLSLLLLLLLARLQEIRGGHGPAFTPGLWGNLGGRAGLELIC